MLRNYDTTVFKEHVVTEGEKTSCLIPLMPGVSFDLSVRCEKEAWVSMVTEDGQTIPMEAGKIVNMKGINRNFQAIDVSTDTTFWYRCLLSRTDEVVDPVPAKVELVQSSTDVLKAMIDDRLRQWKVAQELNRELTDEEKDELILDIARGDLEFEMPPDEFGLGYEERFAEFVAKQKEAQEPPEAAPEPASSVSGGAPSVPAEGAKTSPTVPST